MMCCEMRCGQISRISSGSCNPFVSLQLHSVRHTAGHGTFTRCLLDLGLYGAEGEEGTLLAVRAWELYFLAHEIGATFLGEFPEGLGATNTGVFQCEFGAQTPKPTRFITDLMGFEGPIHSGSPQCNKNWKYQGPLPAQCPHPGSHELSRPAAPAGPSASDGVVESSTKKAKRIEGYAQVLRFKPDVAWKLWYMLIQRWKRECAMYIETHEFRWELEALSMLLDIFAARSPYALRKRALAVMRICDYLEMDGYSRFPIVERDMYAFLCAERNDGAPAWRLKGYVQGVNFCRFAHDMTDLAETVNSARCRGTTRQKNIAEKNQATPLLVKEVKLLHEVLSKSEDIWFRLFAGAALFCLYARARWGDLMRAEYVLVDCDSSGKACYLEARVGSHKTMQSQQHRHQFLPMVAPGLGVTEDPWIEQWLKVRQRMSLSLDEGGVMPAPQPDGSPGCRPIDSQEGAGWLRLILFGDSSPLKDRKVASHSPKATLLSYAAKRGLDISLRMQLGYTLSHIAWALHTLVMVLLHV